MAGGNYYEVFNAGAYNATSNAKQVRVLLVLVLVLSMVLLLVVLVVLLLVLLLPVLLLPVLVLLLLLLVLTPLPAAGRPGHEGAEAAAERYGVEAGLDGENALGAHRTARRRLHLPHVPGRLHARRGVLR